MTTASRKYPFVSALSTHTKRASSTFIRGTVRRKDSSLGNSWCAQRRRYRPYVQGREHRHLGQRRGTGGIIGTKIFRCRIVIRHLQRMEAQAKSAGAVVVAAAVVPLRCMCTANNSLQTGWLCSGIGTDRTRDPFGGFRNSKPPAHHRDVT